MLDSRRHRPSRRRLYWWKVSESLWIDDDDDVWVTATWRLNGSLAVDNSHICAATDRRSGPSDGLISTLSLRGGTGGGNRLRSESSWTSAVSRRDPTECLLGGDRPANMSTGQGLPPRRLFTAVDRPPVRPSVRQLSATERNVPDVRQQWRRWWHSLSAAAADAYSQSR